MARDEIEIYEYQTYIVFKFILMNVFEFLNCMLYLYLVVNVLI